MTIAWKGESLSARPARKTSLFGKSTLASVDRDEKARSVVALSRVPRLARFAGSPPAVGSSWGSYLASCPDPLPTDTRPQARAYWASLLFVRIVLKRKWFFRRREGFFFTVADTERLEMVGEVK